MYSTPAMGWNSWNTFGSNINESYNGYDFMVNWLFNERGEDLIDVDDLLSGDIDKDLFITLMSAQKYCKCDLLAGKYIYMATYYYDSMPIDNLTDVFEYATGGTLDDLLDDNEFYDLLDQYEVF